MASVKHLKESVRLERERLDADILSFEASKATFLAEKKSYEDARKHLEAAKAEGMRRFEKLYAAMGRMCFSVERTCDTP